jgi:isopenicillin-N epimerase
LVVSHGANKPLSDESQRFLAEFEWTGTLDPTPFLSIPAAIDAMAEMVPGGWPEIMQRNRRLAIDARRMLLKRWDLPELCPDSMLGSIATIQLGDVAPDGRTSLLQPDPWQQRLFDEHQIEVPLFSWPAPPKRMLRISAQLYNAPSDYENLAEAIESLAR